MKELFDSLQFLVDAGRRLERLKIQLENAEATLETLKLKSPVINFTREWLDDYWPVIELGSYHITAVPHGTAGQPAWSYQRITGEKYGNGAVAMAEWKVAPRADGKGDVVGFPCIKIGQKPGHATTDNRYPIKVADAAEVLSTKIIKKNVTGKGHLCWNMWFQPTPERAANWDAATRSAEVIVQINRWGDYSNPYGRDGGRNLKNLQRWIDYKGHKCALFIEHSGAGADVPLFLIIPPDNVNLTVLDMKEMVAGIKELNRNHYLCSVELGVEIITESGTIVFSLENSD